MALIPTVDIKPTFPHTPPHAPPIPAPSTRTTATRQKAKPPPYPRPVPSFVVEELPPTAEDVAWSKRVGLPNYYLFPRGDAVVDDGEEDGIEIERETRATKRRKIQTHTEACLRGQSLYIMSAQLRGPFNGNKGWKNPWARKREISLKIRKVVSSGIIEIPETARKSAVMSSIEETRHDELGETEVVEPTPRVLSGYDSTSFLAGGRPDALPAESAPSPFTSRIINRIANGPEAVTSVDGQHKTEKQVEHWLKTNDSYAKKSEVLVHSSPTPASRPLSTPNNNKGNRIGLPLRLSQSEPARGITPKMSSPRIGTAGRKQLGSGNLSAVERRVQQLSRDMQSVLAEPIVPVTSELYSEVRRLTHARSPSNGELDLLYTASALPKAKHTIIHTVPADTHMSPFEFRKVSDNASKRISKFEPVRNGKGVVPGDVDLDLEDFDRQDPREQKESIEQLPPSIVGDVQDAIVNAIPEVFSTAPQTGLLDVEDGGQTLATHRGAIGNTAPAHTEILRQHDIRESDVDAQVASYQSLQPSTENILPSAQALPDQIQSTAGDARDEKLLSIKNLTSGSEQAEKAAVTENGKSMVAPPVPSEKRKPPQLDATHTPSRQTDLVNLNTQEMLAKIEPLDMSTVKVLKQTSKKETPQTVTKVRQDKKRKTTSFAVDTPSVSSIGSIRNAMKAKVGKPLGSPPQFLLGKIGTGLKDSDEENSSQPKRQRRQSSAGKPKSILKSTNLTSSPGDIMHLKSGPSTGKDGEQGHMVPLASGQNGPEGDDFDLDAAIDDLGSFLGTWNVEKEASGISANI